MNFVNAQFRGQAEPVARHPQRERRREEAEQEGVSFQEIRCFFSWPFRA